MLTSNFFSLFFLFMSQNRWRRVQRARPSNRRRRQEFLFHLIWASITLDHGSAPGTDEGALRGRNHSFKSSSRRRQSRGSVQDSAYSPSYTWPRMTWRLENVMSDLSGRSQLWWTSFTHAHIFTNRPTQKWRDPFFYNGRLEISMVFLSKDMIAKFVRFC